MRSTKHRVLFLVTVALVASSTILGSLGATRARAQLVGYWNFDGNVLDHSGTGNHGTLNGGMFDAANVPPVLGGGESLNLNSLNTSDHVLVPANPSLDSSVFTLSLFFNDRGQVSGINRLTSRGGDSFETGIDIALGSNSIAYFPGWTTTGAVPAMNVWNHVAFVADGASMTVYLNGAPVFGPAGFAAAPTGNLRIGSRENGPGEGFNGWIDDVALFNVALTPAAIEQLADGLATPLTVDTSGQEPVIPNLVVSSNLAGWSLSTVSEDGGPAGPWTPSGNAPPAADTYTLPVPELNPARTNISGAASSLEVEPIGAISNVHFYRTTFQLDPFVDIAASLSLAVDNGAEVYLNGQLIASETSFVVENWTLPLPSLRINEDGSISDVVKFDSAASSFSGFQVGENELVVAVRNPNSEEDPIAGGFAFRMDIFTTPVPEPATAGYLLALISWISVARYRSQRAG